MMARVVIHIRVVDVLIDRVLWLLHWAAAALAVMALGSIVLMPTGTGAVKLLLCAGLAAVIIERVRQVVWLKRTARGCSDGQG